MQSISKLDHEQIVGFWYLVQAHLAVFPNGAASSRKNLDLANI